MTLNAPTPELEPSQKSSFLSFKLPFGSPYWRWIRLAILMSMDAATFSICYAISFYLRLDMAWYAGFAELFWRTLPLWVGVNIAVFWWGGMYRQVWRYANFNSALLVGRSVFFGGILAYAGSQFLVRDLPPAPRSIPVIFMLLSGFLIGIQRFSWRAIASAKQGASAAKTKRERALIYGAGSGGDLLARHIAANPAFPYYAVGFVDDDRNKRGRIIHGLRILGTGEELVRIIQQTKAEAVLLAMPGVPGKIIRGVVEKCQKVGIKPLIMPDIATSLGEGVFKPRPLDIKDLLKRAPKSINERQVKRFFEGRSVLVTGAGGSIGSEIARQALTFQPSHLILLDVSEFNLYSIGQELSTKVGTGRTEIHLVLGSAAEERVVERVFEQFHPQIVLHAAAYKHVPLLESNASEGIINNITATRVMAEAAIRNKVERLLLISSDKAVRPTNVMGATKRCCELVIQALQMRASKDKIGLCSVRFGNVLGSSGSVLPLFLNQIEQGGPVTVTHPEVTRFFMLTSEAVGLVLQSIAMSTGGETFVLDMGEPVRIYDMAQQLIRLSGKEPGKDIDVIFTGLRPGEKLYEELILEGAEKHELHDEVYIAVPHPFDAERTLAAIDHVVDLAKSGDEAKAIKSLMEVVSNHEATGTDASESQASQEPPVLH